MGRYSKDRHEYNNKLSGISCGNNSGIGIFITLILLIFGALFYGIYKAYQNYHNGNYSKSNNVNNEIKQLVKNNPNVKITISKNVKKEISEDVEYVNPT